MGTNNLTEFLTEVAAAIRTRDGTSDKIDPQDFVEKILALPSANDAWLLSLGTKLVGGTNLNTLTSVGNYYVDSATARNIGNTPSKYPYVLKVFKAFTDDEQTLQFAMIIMGQTTYSCVMRTVSPSVTDWVNVFSATATATGFQVGDILQTESEISPAERYGGSWEEIEEGTFIMAAGSRGGVAE